jgi:hypothetical protein
MYGMYCTVSMYNKYVPSAIMFHKYVLKYRYVKKIYISIYIFCMYSKYL